MTKQQKLVGVLKTLRKNASLENAGFSDFECGNFKFHFPFEMKGVTTDQLTNSIKESTRIHRETWILPIIDDLIAWGEGKKDMDEIVRFRL